jgi:hydroxyacyl-ACP dehydratase HTD2-like protein with hotdog domain
VTISLSLGDIGLTEETASELSVEHTARIGATIDATVIPADGEGLPLLWHWAHFTPTTATGDLGADGHPRLPDGPVARYPRRMWASGTVEAPGQLIVGQPATRTSQIIESRKSEGRSGALLIVRLQHRYRQFDAVQIAEEQVLVYRTPSPPVELPIGDHQPEVRPDQWQERHTPNTATLFRFSAITFNSHRIHYDQSYVTGVEAYPALVVHGPLIAVLVGESLRRHFGQELSRFEFRANAPLFVDLPFTIVGTAGPVLEAKVIRNDGTETMTVAAMLRN